MVIEIVAYAYTIIRMMLIIQAVINQETYLKYIKLNSLLNIFEN